MKKRLNLFYGIVGALILPLTVLASSQSGSKYSPTFSPGYLFAWWICSRRKKQPIGGWLLFFYWQLYGGLLVSAVLFTTNLQSYVPENFDSTGQFALFLASTAPVLLLFALKCAIATLLSSMITIGPL